MAGEAGEAGASDVLQAQEDERRMKFSYAVAEMIAMPPHTKQLLLQVSSFVPGSPIVWPIVFGYCRGWVQHRCVVAWLRRPFASRHLTPIEVEWYLLHGEGRSIFFFFFCHAKYVPVKSQGEIGFNEETYYTRNMSCIVSYRIKYGRREVFYCCP